MEAELSRIVVGVDDGDRARDTVDLAADIARRAGARLHVVAAVAPDAPAPAALLAGVGTSLRERGVDVETAWLPGDPAEALRAVARRTGADLVVCGAELGWAGVRGAGPPPATSPLAARVGRGAPWRVWDTRAVPHRQHTPPPATPPAPAEPRRQDTPAPATPPAPAEPPDAGQTPRATRVLALTTVALFMAFLDVTIVNTAFPDIRATFPETPLADLSWVLNAYNVVFAALLMPAGRLADRIGRRRVFHGGLLTFLGGSLLCGLAPSAEALIAARVIQAAGAAALVPSSLGLALPEFSVHRRAAVASVWAAAGAVAAAAGPSLGGVLVDSAGWRWAFLVNLVVALVFIPGRRLLTESYGDDESSRGRPDLAGGALLTVGIGALALGIVKAPDWGWADTRVLGCFAVAIATLAALGPRSVRHPSPVIEPALMRVRSLAVTNVAVLVFAAGFYALLLGNILFLTSVWGYSILEAGFAVTPGPIAAAIAARPAGRLAERLGYREVGVAAALLFAVACLMYRQAGDATPDYVTAWLPAQLLSGVAIGAIFSVLSAAALADMPPARVATGTAMASCFRQIGGVLGIAILVAIVGTPTSIDDAVAAFDAAWLFEALTALGTAVATLGLVARRRRPRTEAEPYPAFPARQVVVGGRTVTVRVAGSGPPVLLLHGMVTSSASWRRIARELSAEHTVIAPDLFCAEPAYGDSCYDGSLASNATLLRDLLDELGHPRIAVVGHSLGGALAMAFAWQYPGYCSRLTLISSGGLGREVHPALRAVALSGAGPVLALAANRVTLGTVRLGARLAGRPTARGPVHEVLTTIEALRGRPARLALLTTVRDVIGVGGQRMRHQRAGAMLAETPTLLIWGTRDGIVPSAHGVAFHEAHPDSRMVLVDGAGHCLHLRQAAFVAAQLRTFLAGGAEPAPPVPLLPPRAPAVAV